MQTGRYTRIPGMTLAILLTLRIMHGLVCSPEARAEESRDLEGSWINTVKVYLKTSPEGEPCPPAPSNVIPFESMSTYMYGGTLIAGGSGPVPGGSVSTSHGIWEHAGHRTFRAFFRQHHFNSAGRRIMIVEVTSYSSLINGDNPDTPEVEPYYLSANGSNMVTNLDPATGEVINVIARCNETTSRPIVFED